jgi:RNA polymerase sigma-70 factor (ECF subfamily)
MTVALHWQLETLRPALLRFAILQLCDEALAEGVAQDALIAVPERPERFAGQSSLRSYIIGIMKHKIIDALRASKNTGRPVRRRGMRRAR